MRNLPAESGFTMIELLVALAIVAILTSQLFLVFQTQKQAYLNNSRVLDVQEDARLVVDLITADARMAGYMVPRIAGVASVDGGTGGSDSLCVSDWSLIDDSTLGGVSDHFTNAHVGSLTTTQVVLTSLGEKDVDGDGSVDFQQNQGIIISNGVASHCARITNDPTASTTTITFVPAIPTTAPPTGGLFANLNASPGSVRVVPAVRYAASGGLGLTRNGTLISSEIEDLQVQFGVDANSDRALTGSEFPIDVLPGNNASRVRSIRISVIARTPQPDPEWNGPGRPASANRVAGAADSFRRRRFITDVLPRNLL
jgi:prepilin-type N-terminal cleavage/methylation domain-containing protein